MSEGVIGSIVSHHNMKSSSLYDIKMSKKLIYVWCCFCFNIWIIVQVENLPYFHIFMPQCVWEREKKTSFNRATWNHTFHDTQNRILWDFVEEKVNSSTQWLMKTRNSAIWILLQSGWWWISWELWTLHVDLHTKDYGIMKLVLLFYRGKNIISITAWSNEADILYVWDRWDGKIGGLPNRKKWFKLSLSQIQCWKVFRQGDN